MVFRNIGFFIGLCVLCFLVTLNSCGTSQPVTQQKAPTSDSGDTAGSSEQPADATVAEATAEPSAMPSPTEAPTETPLPSPTPTSAPMVVEDINVQSGRVLYGEVCAPCHGLNARGIEGIGVDLIKSEFVAGLDVEELGVFLIQGLSVTSPFNISGIRMPPRGGRNDLNDQEMLNIAAYLQRINTVDADSEARQVVAYRKWVASGGDENIASMPEVGNEGLTGDALEGQTTYLRFCSVCHGPNAEGVKTLGKGFRGSEFISELSDKELAEFIGQGRSSDDELNETGIEMLPYGGQPYLTDDQLSKLVAYIRVVNTQDEIPAIAADIEHLEDREGPAEHEELEQVAFEIIDNVTPRCFSCHLISERGNKNGPGPHLNGLNERAGERVAGLSAEEYVRQSILDPGAHLVEECPRGPCVDVMVKNYSEKLTDEQLDTLVGFLLSLPTDAEIEGLAFADAEDVPSDAGDATDEVVAEDDDAVHVRAVDLLAAWVDEGSEDGDFEFIAEDGTTYTADFEHNVLPLFVTPGIWYANSEACINCHYENSEDSDHEMDLGTYEGIIAGADVLSSPPGVAIVEPGDWEHSVLRSRLRDTRMPPEPGWEWDPTEENRDGPTLTINEGEIRAVNLLEEWVNQGAENGEFTFEGTDGKTYTASFDADVLPLFTEPGAWYAESTPCTDCHYENTEDSDHEMDLTSYEGIMLGADVLSDPPGVAIVVPGDWENSKLRSRLRNTRMPPSPGWEWDRTEENRDGPMLRIPQP